jgi:hypothetical protein
MNPHELNTLLVVHVASVLVATAFTYIAFAAPPETRKRVLAYTGVASLFILLTGIRMWQGEFQFAMMGWVLVKLVCFLGFSALAGLAYRKREKAGMLMILGFVFLFTAVAMAYIKPF